jgi:copper homeostasis protein
MTKPLTLEVCVDSVESAIAAGSGGAHRLELCSDLGEGGVTPSSGLIALVREKIAIALHVMVRPRASDFCYTDDEFMIMQRDVLMAKQLGADGVVLGILDLDGGIDIPRTKQLVDLAAPLNVTFHRAFDMSPDLLKSLRDLQSTGVDRVLTSGGKQTAIEGAAALKQLVDAAKNDIGIMAASGIEEHNVAELLERTGVREVHASLRSAVPSSMRYQNQQISMGTSKGREYQRFVVDKGKVEKLLAGALDGIEDKAASHSPKTRI